MAEVGRNTLLDNEMLGKIKQGILDGLTLKEIAQQSEISENTMYCWTSDNYLGLADKIEGWKRDRKLLLADKRIEEILQLDVTNKDYTRTVGDMSKFVKETLDKENYSKRNELTGAGGKDLSVNVVNYGDTATVQLPTEDVSSTTVKGDR